MTDWKKSYILGIASIDEQHSKWIEMIMQMIDAKDTADKETILLGILDQLGVYTDSHFAYEERLFQKHNYPFASEHMESHQAFLSKLEKFHKDVKAGNAPMNSMVLAEMRTWLIDHICTEDAKYVSFFTSKGVK